MGKEKKPDPDNEKSKSSSSVSFKEALAAFLKVKPASKEEMDKALREEKEKKEKPSD